MEQKVCVVIPTYNNSGTISKVVEAALERCPDVYVVSDGADAPTLAAIDSFGDRIRKVAYTPNRGKGFALKTAFDKALSDGFDYAVTMDSDGQHFAEDIPAFMDSISRNAGALIIGSRCLWAENMPVKHTFMNKFSNFWFSVMTLQSVPDTQTGFRAYPLQSVPRPHTNRYEAELEMLVHSAWKGIKLIPMPIKVYYPPGKERVSFYRYGKDTVRISAMYTVLFFAAIFYGWPSMLYHKLKGKRG